MSKEAPANAHEELLYSFPSAYRMAKDTGIPSSTCKVWWRKGKIPDAGKWWGVWYCATEYGYSEEYHWAVMKLAEDYNA